MSIYATLWEIKVPREHCFDEDWARVYAQAVPAHIGHPSEYPDGDPYAAFLPPVVAEYDPQTGDAPYHRAVVIVQEGRHKKLGQRYVDPLFVMTGKEYLEIPFHELLERIHEAIGWDEDVIAVSLVGGERKIIRTKREHRDNA